MSFYNQFLLCRRSRVGIRSQNTRNENEKERNEVRSNETMKKFVLSKFQKIVKNSFENLKKASNLAVNPGQINTDNFLTIENCFNIVNVVKFQQILR